jgi:hypothetical protein
MKSTLLLAAAWALALAAPCLEAQAAQGDVYVAAHRTRDGSYVPANVPPSSGGTRPASRLGRSGASPRAAHGSRNAAIVAPIFVRAKSLLR